MMLDSSLPSKPDAVSCPSDDTNDEHALLSETGSSASLDTTAITPKQRHDLAPELESQIDDKLFRIFNDDATVRRLRTRKSELRDSVENSGCFSEHLKKLKRKQRAARLSPTQHDLSKTESESDIGHSAPPPKDAKSSAVRNLLQAADEHVDDYRTQCGKLQEKLELAESRLRQSELKRKRREQKQRDLELRLHAMSERSEEQAHRIKSLEKQLHDTENVKQKVLQTSNLEKSHASTRLQKVVSNVDFVQRKNSVLARENSTLKQQVNDVRAKHLHRVSNAQERCKDLLMNVCRDVNQFSRKLEADKNNSRRLQRNPLVFSGSYTHDFRTGNKNLPNKIRASELTCVKSEQHIFDLNQPTRDRVDVQTACAAERLDVVSSKKNREKRKATRSKLGDGLQSVSALASNSFTPSKTKSSAFIKSMKTVRSDADKITKAEVTAFPAFKGSKLSRLLEQRREASNPKPFL